MNAVNNHETPPSIRNTNLCLVLLWVAYNRFLYSCIVVRTLGRIVIHESDTFRSVNLANISVQFSLCENKTTILAFYLGYRKPSRNSYHRDRVVPSQRGCEIFIIFFNKKDVVQAYGDVSV